MWWLATTVSPLATATVFFSSAPDGEHLAAGANGQPQGLGREPAGTAQHLAGRRCRRAPPSRRSGCGWGGRGSGCPSTSGPSRARRRRRRGRSDRRTGCRWSARGDGPAPAIEQVVQRRVRQHHAELGQARRHPVATTLDAGRAARRASTIGRRAELSAAAADRRRGRRARRACGEVGGHDGERLVVARLAPPQLGRRRRRRWRQRRGGSRRCP